MDDNKKTGIIIGLILLVIGIFTYIGSLQEISNASTYNNKNTKNEYTKIFEIKFEE